MSSIEYERILQKRGKPISYDYKHNRCSCLSKNKECEVYSVRPFICRLFGLVEAMKCPHGCVPERWVSDLEAKQLLDIIEELSNNQGPKASF